MIYDVKIETFEGPLDVLLHLVVKHEMDIYDIPMAQITSQYLAFLEQMQEQNLDIASDFLVMAATLVFIKSKVLLPVQDVDNEDEEEADPRAELVQRLLEYRRYKEGAERLAAGPQLNRDVFARPETSPDPHSVQQQTEALAGDVGIYQLVQALRELLDKAIEPACHEVHSSGLTIAQGISRLLKQLLGHEQLSFTACFASLPNREEIVVMFIAVLELVKLHLCRIVQLNPHGTIYIYPGDAVRHGRIRGENWA